MAIERFHLLPFSHRLQTEHRRAVTHFLELVYRLCAHPHCGRVVRSDLRESLFQLFQPVKQPVINRVRNLRLTLYVVEMVVMTNPFPKRPRFFGRSLLPQLVHGFEVRAWPLLEDHCSNRRCRLDPMLLYSLGRFQDPPASSLLSTRVFRFAYR
jgi:hypothetical protein